MAKQPTEYDYQEAEAAGLGYMRHCLIQSSAIDDVRVTDSMLKVLVALGSYASRKNSNWCWAKENSIALRLGVSRRLVRQATSALKACGYIEIREAFKKDGGQISNSYRILLDFELPDEHRRAEGQRSRAGMGGRPRHTPRNSEFQGGRNSEFQGGRNSEFQGGVNSEFQGGVNSEFRPLNTESEGVSLRRKKKIVSSHSVEKNTQDTPHLEPPSVKPITEIRRDVGDTPPPPIPPAPASALPAPSVTDTVVPAPCASTWAQVRMLVEPAVSPAQKREYLDRIELLRAAPDDYLIVAPTPFVAEMCENLLGGHLRTALHTATGRPDVRLGFLVNRGKVRA